MIYAGILAAGLGKRMNRQDLPKQFLPLGDKPLIVNTLEQFYINPSVNRVILVVPEEWKLFTEDMIKQYDNMNTEIHIITGGKNKALSINMIVDFISETWGITADDILIAHDGVRPFVTQRIIDENIDAAKECGMSVTAGVTNDTILVSEDGDNVSGFPDKMKMLAEQTPLTFRLELLCDLYERAKEENIQLEKETELGRLCLKFGYDMKIVYGDSSNMKIITPYDLKIANALLSEKKL